VIDSLYIPDYGEIATSQGESSVPTLWDSLGFLICPVLGPSGLIDIDLSGAGLSSGLVAYNKASSFLNGFGRYTNGTVSGTCSLDLSAQTIVTVEFWATALSYANPAYVAALGVYPASGWCGVYTQVSGAMNGGVAGPSNTYNIQTTPNYGVVGIPIHVVWVFNKTSASGTYVCVPYINGIPPTYSTSGSAATFTGSSQNFMSGTLTVFNNGSGSYNFIGYLAKLAIYTRALQHSEIALLAADPLCLLRRPIEDSGFQQSVTAQIAAAATAA